MAKGVLADSDLARLEKLVGFQFTDRERVRRAFTHSSAPASRAGSYERLEFLGDRVLGLVIAEMLFENFADASEGELSVRLNQLVSARTCAAVCDDLGLHAFIRTGSDVKTVTGKRMQSVRADVMKSLIAAIYMDGGLDAARAFVRTNWTVRAQDEHAARRDAKTELQEWAHARNRETPAYRIVERSGPDHDPQFTVRVEVRDLAPEIGVARSKRAAEQVAATAMLRREGVWPAEPKEKGTA